MMRKPDVTKGRDRGVFNEVYAAIESAQKPDATKGRDLV